MRQELRLGSNSHSCSRSLHPAQHPAPRPTPLAPLQPTCSALSRPWIHWYSMLVIGCRRQLLGNSRLW